MTSRDRFLNAFTNNAPDRPPVWIMRQAGRYLPEYRELKTKYDFVTMVKTPDLATEVTLQPLRRFPQLDAAIIFSDILIVPEAMGLPYSFREQGGIEMAGAIRSHGEVETLDPSAVREKTAYIADALRLVRAELGNSKALLGFGGAPWTLATYMIEGGSSKDFSHARDMFIKDRALFDCLMEKLTLAVIELFKSQVEAGVDAVQIFDSWAAAAPEGHYWDCSLKWINRIIEAIPKTTPVILFSKGMTSHRGELAKSGARALAADHSIDLPSWRSHLPADIAVQGNLDPEIMTGEPKAAAEATHKLLYAMAPWKRYIFNLGHGITPQARIETVQAVLETIDGAKQKG
ncbi:uroporphyrinogen decarboxylase [Puniceicoccales bacterium CK1056]|uniref:Uroporphyrinogen decarboxylase n=1 Tax=Oceanipulchritudo coccoides TaxID=2706888 RepID=A0A6B2M0W7_9BACT|nr:uroporphyrinogen decarboxylase [Oceanipulchritudo coccoides]NDV61744.1 uroporphyrinogen decarboxylase [Oceanipulchritudo coccoides]